MSKQLLSVKITNIKIIPVKNMIGIYDPSCRTATLDFFSNWLNLKSQCFCALS